MFKKPLKFNLQYFAEGDPKPDPKPDPAPKTFTQEQIDALLEERLQRERKKYAGFEDYKTKAAKLDELEASQKSDLEKLTGERDTFKKQSEETALKANEKIVKSEAKAVAAELGIKSDRIAYAIRLVDLSKVTVDENGDADSASIKQLFEDVLKAVPELKGVIPPVGGGTNPPNHSNVVNPYLKESYNMTKQAELERTNPTLAAQFAAAAGVKI
jgi:hypothetical protein